MSGQPDLNLDDILAEFYREENQAAQSPEPPAAIPRPAPPQAAPILSSGEKPAEGTILYEGRPGRHAAPAPEPEAAPEPEEEERPAPRQAERPAPKQTDGQSAKKQAKKPAPKQQTEKPAPKRSPAKGFALMILVLLLLGAVLAGLLRWTLQAEEAAAPKEPEPLRLELGLNLERSLDESAGTTR